MDISMKDVVLAGASWLLSLFFIYFAVTDLRNGYVRKRFEEGRYKRGRDPFQFWIGIVVAFICAAFLIGFGVFVFLGKVNL
jgi:hypothetical protein